MRRPSRCSRPRSVDPPLPAAGYQLPIEVDNPTDAANLAVRMEEDAAVAWRAVLEQATDEQDRAFAVTALTECAVTAARWSRVLGIVTDHRRLPRRQPSNCEPGLSTPATAAEMSAAAFSTAISRVSPVNRLRNSTTPSAQPATHHDDPRHPEQLGVLELHAG